MEDLLIHLKSDLKECKEAPYWPDNDSMREGYITALETIIAYIEDSRE